MYIIKSCNNGYLFTLHQKKKIRGKMQLLHIIVIIIGFSKASLKKINN